MRFWQGNVTFEREKWMGQGVFADVEAIERRLGLPKGFYTHLLEEDDWSFVIKTSAFLEDTCSHILAKRLGAPELAEAFGHLECNGVRVARQLRKKPRTQ